MGISFPDHCLLLHSKLLGTFYNWFVLVLSVLSASIDRLKLLYLYVDCVMTEILRN